jgi:hypothetical protein
VRSETDKHKVMEFLSLLGSRVHGPGKVYLTGGATALLQGWRETTVDIDISGFAETVEEFCRET